MIPAMTETETTNEMVTGPVDLLAKFDPIIQTRGTIGSGRDQRAGVHKSGAERPGAESDHGGVCSDTRSVHR